MDINKLKDGAIKFEDSLSHIDVLNRIQEQIEKKVPVAIPRTLIVVSAGFFTFAFLYFTLGPAHVTNLLGFALPAVASFHAIESVDKADDTQWLTYWVVFSAFSLVETFADMLSENFPMYYAFKFAFLIFLAAPNTRGAETIYKNFLRPLLLENESSIDKAITQAESTASDIGHATQDIARDNAGDLVDGLQGVVSQDYEQVEKTEAEE